MSRIRRRQTPLIAIICEGESEAAYFNHLERFLIDAGLGESIPELIIHPNPKPEKPSSKRGQKQKNSRPLRPTSDLLKEKLKPDSLEEIQFKNKFLLKSEETWPHPVHHIKRARDYILDYAPIEAWAVFDADGHPKVKEAFDFAAMEVEGITISVAFSKLSFEFWKLLHFEFAPETFHYTQHHTNAPATGHSWPPRDGKKRKKRSYLVPCGQEDPVAKDHNCMGLQNFFSPHYAADRPGPCLIGRLRARGYLPDYQKGPSASDFPALFPQLPVAIARAEILRAKLIADFGALKPYEYPYFTNLDTLILSIAKGHPDWKASKEVIYISDSTPVRMGNGIIVKAGLIGAHLTMEVTNNSQITIAEQDFKSISPIPQQSKTDNLSLIEVGNTAKITFMASNANDLRIIRYKDTLIGVAIDQFQSSLPDDSVERT